MKPTYRKSWARNLLMRSDLTLDPSLKVFITRFLLVLQVCNVKPTYRKSWAGNLLMWSDLTLCPFFKVKRGQPNLIVPITCLLLVLEVCNMKPTYRKSWAGNLLMSVEEEIKNFARNLKLATSKTLYNSMKKIMLCLKLDIFQLLNHK